MKKGATGAPFLASEGVAQRFLPPFAFFLAPPFAAFAVFLAIAVIPPFIRDLRGEGTHRNHFTLAAAWHAQLSVGALGLLQDLHLGWKGCFKNRGVPTES